MEFQAVTIPKSHAAGSDAKYRPASAARGAPFDVLFGEAQAVFGARIDAMVAAIIPDGRGLADPAPDSHDTRIAELQDDSDRAANERRETHRAGEEDELAMKESRPSEARGRRSTKVPPPPVREQDAIAMTARSFPIGPVAASVRPAAQGVTSQEPAIPDESEQAPIGKGTGAAATNVRSTPSAIRIEPPPVQPAAAAPMVSAPAGEVPSASANDGGAAARQIGELLGARESTEPIRSMSAVRSAPAANAGAGKQADAGGPRSGTRTPSSPRESTRAQEPPSPTRADFDRLVRSLRMNIGRRESTARMRLQPPELGRLRIDVRMVDRKLDLVIRTETSEARDVLRSRLDGLREALAQHGLNIERLDLPAPSADGRDAALAGQNDAPHREPAHADSQPGAGRDEGRAGDSDSSGVPLVGEEAIMSGAAMELRLDVRA